MDFVKLPDHFQSRFVGINSPIILRAEAGCIEGGMVVEEYRNTVPNVHLYGDTRAARDQFARAITVLAKFNQDMPPPRQRADYPRVSQTFFQIEVRRPDYHATLWGDANSYDFHWAVADGVWLQRPYVGDFRQTHERLKTIYEKFFDTVL